MIHSLLKRFSALACGLFLMALPGRAAQVTASFNAATDIPVTSAGYTATGNTVSLTLNFTPTVGTDLTVVKNTGLDFIQGAFGNLAQGQAVALVYKGITYNFIANYYGGTGNDFVLQWADSLAYGWGNNGNGALGVGNSSGISLPTAVTNTGVLAGKSIVSISAGFYFSVALCADGTVATWGKNGNGQLGNNTTVDSNQPVNITSMGVLATKRVVAVSAGYQHCLALCSDGTVAAWGNNGNGQLGSGNKTSSSIPVAVVTTGVLAGRSVAAISAGDFFSLALCSDGGPVAWGTGGNGQLGQATVGTESSVPLNVVRTGVLAGKTVSAVSAGSAHVLALCSDGTMVAWGSNNHGETGGSSGAPPRLLAPLGILSGKTVSAISAGQAHSLALCSDGTLAAWGNNSHGELGNGSYVDSSTPIAVSTSGVLAGKTVTAIAGGYTQSAALCSDGTLVGWGDNSLRQMGNRSVSGVETVPVLVATSPFEKRKAVKLASGHGAYHLFAQAALPVPESDSTLSSLIPSAGNFEPAFASGTLGYSACVSAFTDSVTLTPAASNAPASITVNGTPVASGAASLPIPLSNGSNTIPVTVTAVDGSTTTYVVTILRPTSLVAAYGSADFIPLSTPAFDATGLTVAPTLGFSPPNGRDLVVVRNTGLRLITGSFANMAQGATVSLSYAGRTYEYVADYFGGSGNDLVLHWKNQKIYAIGNNEDGQLGNNSQDDSNLPAPVTSTGVLAGKTVTAMARSDSHTLALCSDGTIAAWGDNAYGQLGNGSGGFEVISNVPVAVTISGALAGKTVAALAASSGNSFALCSDGTVVSWGNNSSGQLGIGSTGSTSKVPVAVSTAGVLSGRTVVGISAGQNFAVALCSDGKLVSWGLNSNGRLGNNSTTTSNVPVAVDNSAALAGKRVTAISAGSGSSIALCSDGTVVSWGDSTFGQLGNGYSYDNVSPVVVKTAAALGGRVVTGISAGVSHAFAYCADGTFVAWGDNSFGAFGNNTETDSTVPVLVAPIGALTGRTVTNLVAGYGNSLALCSDGTLAGWGSNSYGQLGNGSNDATAVPVMASTSSMGTGEKFTGLSVGARGLHAGLIAAIPHPSSLTGLTGLSLDSATLSPAFGPEVLGYTATVPNATTSILVTPTALNANVVVTVNGKSVASGTASAPIPLSEGGNAITIIATSQDGTVSKTYSITVTRGITLNASFTSSSSIPVTASAYNASGSVINFSLGYAPVTGAVLTVIRNTGPAFIGGRFTNLEQAQTVSLTYGNVTYKFIANYYGGSGNDLELVWAGNRTYDWGNNFHGELGNNSTTNSNLPLAVVSGPLVGKSIMRLASGSGHSLALCFDGTLAAWGDPSYGRLGLPGSPTGRLPAATSLTGALAGKTIVAVGGGESHSLFLCSDGSLATLGTNDNGQLGNAGPTGSTGFNSSVPVAVATNGALAGKTATAISVGSAHNLVLCSDGTMVSWGVGNNGQLGTGSTALANTPFAVTTTGPLAGKTVVSIASGSGHNLALCSDGTLVSWGYNSDGQLGNNSTTNSSVPVAINSFGALAGKTVVAIGAGGYHNLALCSDGTLVAWGRNDAGQLGINSITDSLVPVLVNSSGALAGKTIKGLSAGSVHSLVLCSDGTLVAWGQSYAGQFANGTFDVGSRVPVVAAKSGLGNGGVFTSLAAGSVAMHVMTVVSMPLQSVTGLAASAITGVSATLNGQISALGNDVNVTFEYGLDAGYGKSVAAAPATVSGTSITNVSVPITGLVPGTLYHYRVVGSSPAGTVRSGDQTFTTLSDNAKLAGITLSTGVVAPVFDKLSTSYVATVPFATTGITVTPATDQAGAKVKVNGTLVPSGTASATIPLAVGNGTITLAVTAEDGIATKTYTVVVTRLPASFTFNSATDVPVTARGFSAGGFPATLVLNFAPVAGTSLKLVNNTGPEFIYGRFGNLAQGQRVTLSFGGKNYAFVVNYYGGSGNDLVLQWADTKAYAFGANDQGQSGIGSDSPWLLPAPVGAGGVLDGKTILATASGYLHSLALTSEGNIVAWGDNGFGQLGDGTMAEREGAALVTGSALSGRTVVAVSAGAFHSLALCSDGTVLAWGYNNHGQLGNGTTLSSSAPVVVSGGAMTGKKAVAVAAGAYHSLAVLSDGSVVGWGFNGVGSLGDGTTLERLLPVAAAGLVSSSAVVSLSAGQYHNLALYEDGTLAGWGYNNSGQIGDGSTANRIAAVRLNDSGALAGRTITVIAAGGFHSLALAGDGTLAAWGEDASGQLGDGGLAPQSIPVVVPQGGVLSGRTVAGLSAGAEQSYALCLDGTLASWGANLQGQLGNGTTTGGGSIGTVVTSTLDDGALFSAISRGASAYQMVTAVGLPVSAAKVQAAASVQMLSIGDWRQLHFNRSDDAGDAADLADPDHDGISNLFEYAFGLDPSADNAGQLPVARKVGDAYRLEFSRPDGVSGIVYGAEWSPNLAPDSWQPLTDSGTGEQHVFIVPVQDAPVVFMRLKVTLPPDAVK